MKKLLLVLALAPSISFAKCAQTALNGAWSFSSQESVGFVKAKNGASTWSTLQNDGTLKTEDVPYKVTGCRVTFTKNENDNHEKSSGHSFTGVLSNLVLINNGYAIPNVVDFKGITLHRRVTFKK